MSETPAVESRCGFAALMGRPNVGKSTLINRLVGEKLSIVTPKPQTTRHRILGIDSRGDTQIIFVDTPGVHRGQERALNRAMNRTAAGAAHDADVIVIVVEALKWTDEDQDVLDRCKAAGRPMILAVNKVDLVSPRSRLLPYLEEAGSRADFEEIVPLSARRGDNVDALRECVARRLPVGPPLFPPDSLSDRDEAFRIAEVIREKLMYRLREELPYGLTVEVESLERTPDLLRVGAVIWVERAGQKKIVIGAKGGQLKTCGQLAREELEKRLGTKVHLELWVRVKKKWSDSDRALRDLGIDLQ